MSWKWSILIPTVPARRELRKRVLAQLEPQLEGYSDIELLVLEDNRSFSYGDKMQTMIDIAQGEYVNFIDDDDMISRDYVKTIYPLLDGVDSVGITGEVTVEGANPKPVYYSVQHAEWRDEKDAYYRNPQHLTPIKRELVKQIPWNGGYGADRSWSHRMAESGLIKTENVAQGTLYYYLCTEANRAGVWR
jgi:hypothetical protein